MKTTLRYALIAVVLAAVAPLVLRAQQWTRLEFNVGDIVTCVIENEGVLLAGTQHGVVARSTDNGESWMAWDAAFGSVLSMAAHEGYLYAATGDDGIYRSTDNGLTWVPLNNGLAGHVNTVYPMEDTLLAGIQSGGMRCSFDNGDSWFTPYSFNDFLERTALAFTVHNGQLYAGTDWGVYRSSGHEGSWTRMQGPSKAMTNSLAVANGVFYANTEAGIYRMDVGADTLMRTRLLTSASDIAGAGSTIYAGVYGSGVWQSAPGDTGKLWNRMNEGLVNTKTVALDVVGGWLYASFADSTLWRFPLPTEPTNDVAPYEPPTAIDLRIYPNIVDDITTAGITLVKPSSISLALYDAMGRLVSPRIVGEMQTGLHRAVDLKTAGLAPGLYFCVLNASGQKCTRKFIVAR